MLIFLDKFESVIVLDLLFPITTKVLLLALSEYSSSKFLFKNYSKIYVEWRKEIWFNFIFWFSSIWRFWQLMKFYELFLINSSVKWLNRLNHNLRFGGGLNVDILL